MKIIGFSLNNIRLWENSDNKADLIKYVQQLNIGGIEIAFCCKELETTKFTEEQINWIKSLDYVSIHYPTKSKQENSLELLGKIKYFYDLLNAKAVVLHPDVLPEPEVLEKLDMAFCVENLRRGFSINQLKKIFKKYPKLGFCLDVAHAMCWSEKETSRLIEAFKDKLVQVHFSASNLETDHISASDASDSFFRSIQPVKGIDVPIIIETFFEKKDINAAKKEIEFVKNYMDLI